MDKRREHYEKVQDILTSCKNINHLKTGVGIVNQFTKRYKVAEDSKEFRNLKQLLGMMKEKLRFGSSREEERLEEDKLSPSGAEFKARSSMIPSLSGIKYESDDMPSKDLSEKHNVRLKDITDEIKSGKEEEEIEESTSAGSSGSVVGKMGGTPIKRTIYKSDVPVANAGGVSKPIGKIRSFFKKRQLKEVNVHTKKEILESTDGSSIGVYDSPGGWGNNKFMGTKGKRGNAVQRKGNDHKVTYKGDGKNLSTFVKVKKDCKTFPYCVQDEDAVVTSKTPFTKNMDEGIKGVIPNREAIKKSWGDFVTVAKREGKETVEAARILKRVLLRKEVTTGDYDQLKKQSVDIAKIFAIISMGAVSVALPLALEKLLNKKGISIMPTEQKPVEDVDDNQKEIVESICKKTGKSKKYVHSLINKYL